jgi:hypothetical protein
MYEGVTLGKFSACAGILAAAYTLDDNGDVLLDEFERVISDIDITLTDEMHNSTSTDMQIIFDFRVDMTEAYKNAGGEGKLYEWAITGAAIEYVNKIILAAVQDEVKPIFDAGVKKLEWMSTKPTWTTGLEIGEVTSKSKYRTIGRDPILGCFCDDYHHSGGDFEGITVYNAA